MPYSGALVRGDVPIFGVALGQDFKEYRVEFGEGPEPKRWIDMARGSSPRQTSVKSDDLDASLNRSIRGNLATWDTGLADYVYLPSHPADHPTDLKGTYTIRLVVTGNDGTEVEDRVTVTVANVISNAWGGVATSPDGRVALRIPEQALRDVFRLVSFEATGDIPGEPRGTLVGPVYRAREMGETFTVPSTLEIAVPQETAAGVAAGHLGLYGYRTENGRWEYLPSTRSGSSELRLKTSIRTLHAFYAVMASDSPKEGSRLAPPELDGTQATRTAALNSGYLVHDTFEKNTGAWSNRNGAAGGSVALDRTAAFDRSGALKIINTNRGGTFAVNVVDDSFDARAYPLVQFDYRIGPGVKTNLLVKVAGRWYEIGFTDDEKDLRYKRVNIASIGRIEGVVADDEWHTARFNLYDMLRTKTGHVLVEEMVMADWDVPGFMKLAFGANEKGATYYIDNFSIVKDPRAGRRLADEILRIDDFNQKKGANLLGGPSEAFTDGDSRTLRIDFAEGTGGEPGHSLELTADFQGSGTYAGYTTSLENLDLREFQTLIFRVRGLDAAARFWIGLKDHDEHEAKLRVDNYAGTSDAHGWQKVEIPLVAFGSSIHLSDMDNLSLSLVKAAHTFSAVWVDDLAVGRGLRSTMVEDFDHEADSSLLGGRRGTWGEGPAAVSAGYVDSKSGRSLRISFGGSIGEGSDGAPGLGYAVWYMGLGGIDCSACGVLSFRVRGEDGGETPNVYLDDGNHRWGVDIEDYTPVTTSWQTVTIPLSDIAKYGVDLTHLDQIQFAFEWEKMSGTIYVDDIRFGQVEGSLPFVTERALFEGGR